MLLARQQKKGRAMDHFISKQAIGRNRLSVWSWFQAAPKWFVTARMRQRSRYRLAQLGDRELRDIGLTRAEAAYAASRPFWQE
ncbi:MAG: DUF1127 domain-containing protein [Paracoccaceae bacterium]